MIAGVAYIRKYFRFEFEDDRGEIEIDDSLCLKAFWDLDALDHLVYNVDRLTDERTPKYPDRRAHLAYIDLTIGTLSSSEDEYSRVNKVYFEFYNNDLRDLLLERTNIERAELLDKKIPEFFIPYFFEMNSEYNLSKIKHFKLSHFAEEHDDFDIYTTKECREDSDLKEKSKETKKLLPLVFYSAQRLNIRMNRGEPVFVMNASNHIEHGYTETMLLGQEHHILSEIRKVRKVTKRRFVDDTIITLDNSGSGKLGYVIFESEEGKISIDLFCKINERGFISAGSLAYGSVRMEGAAVLFQVNGTGFLQTNNNENTDFWWSNIFGCEVKKGAKCAFWTKGFKKSTGFKLSYVHISP
ncbi:hypothetical protein GCM10010909_33380 [Acidocella aquatica]|uniref:Uncharacterized protein n=1 Tax=Acidocella aquatica TaxID=1922313 RepID=A0ABQ6ACY7_9PROT|nr:hypothetical protein [Acidocella aquatica]GLR68656.1 hypothetical protein GCM10010909_33380 [Acidocella aquatica]